MLESKDAIETNNEKPSFQGYLNPLTGGIACLIEKNLFDEGMLDRIKRFIKFPIRVSCSKTDEALHDMIQAEADELWGSEAETE